MRWWCEALPSEDAGSGSGEYFKAIFSVEYRIPVMALSPGGC